MKKLSLLACLLFALPLFGEEPDHEIHQELRGILSTVMKAINSGNYEFTYWDIVDHVATLPVPPSDLGAWVHLCGVFDGSAYHLYRNGALVASTADATTPPPNIDTIWAIGARAPQPDSLERLFQGEIDDARIYGRALSDAEVEALYRR